MVSIPFALSGKGDEQRAAASLACLLCIQLGSGIESEEVFKTLKPIFKNILADGSANIQARQAVSAQKCILVWWPAGWACAFIKKLKFNLFGFFRWQLVSASAL